MSAKEYAQSNQLGVGGVHKTSTHNGTDKPNQKYGYEQTLVSLEKYSTIRNLLRFLVLIS